jgi:hypothetical protein
VNRKQAKRASKQASATEVAFASRNKSLYHRRVAVLHAELAANFKREHDRPEHDALVQRVHEHRQAVKALRK